MQNVNLKSALKSSIPATAALAMEPMAELVDSMILGQINSSYLSSLLLTNSFLASLTLIFNFLSYGSTARLAFYSGTKDRQGLANEIWASVLIAFGVGLLVSTLLLFFRVTLLEGLMGASPAMIEACSPYWMIRVSGHSFVLLSMSLVGVLRGLLKFKASLWFVLLATLINVLGTYFSVKVFAYGLQGAAISTVASFLISDAAIIFYLWKLGCISSESVSLARVFASLKSIGGEGLGLMLRSSCLTAAFFIMTSQISRIGSAELAAHQVALQIWLFSSYFIDGIAVTATSFGAKLLGEKQFASYKFLGNALLIVASTIGTVFAVVYGFGQNLIISLFTNDLTVVEHLGEIWLYLILSQPLHSALYVYDGLIFGTREFAYLGRRMLEGFCFCFLPLVALNQVTSSSLLGVWFAIFGLNIYRLISGVYYFHARFNSDSERL